MADACCGSGARAEPTSGPTTDDGPPTVRELRHAAAAALLLAISWLLVRAGVPPRIGDVLDLASAVTGAASFVPGALRGLRHGRLGVGLLMTIAAVGAVALGRLGEAALLGVLFSIAEGLEHWAVLRTRRGLRALLALVPRTASVLRDGVEYQVAPDDLLPGDRLLVRAGERAATDAVADGRTSLDLSAITGESVPVEVAAGDEVHAGSINAGSAVELVVTARAVDSSLARIVHLVERAQERKGAGQRVADRVARPLVPAILVLAVLVGGIGALLGDPWLWLERALVVLVAASPCALAISVPLTVVAAIGAASRHGILIKGGGALEALGRVRTVALDKTGTLTRNRPRVIDVVTSPGAVSDDLVALAAALERRSEHPVAAAVIAEADRRGPVTVAAPGEVDTVPGHGLRAMVDDAVVLLGRPDWVAGPAEVPDELRERVRALEGAGATVILLARDGAVLGAIAIRDELRDEARDAVAGLHDLGLGTVMLTGDNPRAAGALAVGAGIATVHAGLRPEDKAARVAVGRTAMVGDGINDAPALATAEVGVAMGAMGTDVALETADVALMGDDLRHVPQTFAHARHARRVMLANVVLSMAIIVVLVPLAALGVFGLATVVAVHELAEVLVILNALRGARITPLPTGPAPPQALGEDGTGDTESQNAVTVSAAVTGSSTIHQ